MGKTAREGPKKLGKKLKQIRERFGLSQNEMLVRLGLDKRLLGPRSLALNWERQNHPCWYCDAMHVWPGFQLTP
jgi:hypothetical protein